LTFPFVSQAKIERADERFNRLFSSVTSRVPLDVPPLSTVGSVAVKKTGKLPGLVGLTRWYDGRQTITFYTTLLARLSDAAYMAIIAHELAHAWLNEHEKPSQSAQREREADELAAKWGFSEELARLEREAESIGGSVY
jgi:hypothetical protein